MKKEHSVTFTISKLNQFREEHQNALKKTYWWKYKTIRYHKNEIDYYGKLLGKLGNNPTIIDIALIVPDSILDKMGW